MISIISIACWIIGGVFSFFLVFPFLTILISRLVKEEKPEIPGEHSFDFGCIITAYKNVEITAPLVASLLHQRYSNFHIYLVADHCNGQSFEIEDDQLTLLIPEQPLNLKAKSIIHGMENYVRPHDYTVIFDADNLAHPDFLATLNAYTNKGHQAIQGQRTAKNLDSNYAAMDALGEFYKNYIERYITYLLGSSAVISGSGMAVET
ncbi:MAG: glycosyltransferase, partial [Saprospiraceae bacterium]|nr:glycosyltransferase [Saprospiraceae bacterium]